jgi:3-methylfumaryl-CoA hydratase
MNKGVSGEVEAKEVQDICSLLLARRMSALLNREEDDFQRGDMLPRGWHVMMFNPPTLQNELRYDGAANLGVEIPDLGLPRLMMGGRKIEFKGDIPIGARVLRRSKLGPVVKKKGRSGPFALINVEHRLSVVDGPQNVVVETSSYIMREEEAGPGGKKVLNANAAIKAATYPSNKAIVKNFIPDETMLFRYSAITDNPHRIHYDYPYATNVEGYPALVVNGTLPQMILLEMFRQHAGREPTRYEGRNLAAIYCGARVKLSLEPCEDGFVLMAQDETGKVVIEASAW